MPAAGRHEPYESLCYESDAEAAEEEAGAKDAANAPGDDREWFQVHIPRRYTVLRWLFALGIGLATAAAAFIIELCVQNLNGLQLAAVFSLRPDASFGAAFFLYAFINLLLVGGAAAAVLLIRPEAAGSGIPDVKVYLNGVACPGVLTSKALVAKILGSILAVSGGLAVGKEGPLIHIGACIAMAFGSRGGPSWWRYQPWLRPYQNDRDRRDLVTCGAAAGVAAAFKAPIGGVLFALEEGCTWWRAELTWRTFFTCAVTTFAIVVFARMCEGHCGFYSNGGLVLFVVHYQEAAYLTFLPVLVFGVLGGLFGSLFTAINVRLNRFRARIIRGRIWLRFVEVLVVGILTSSITFLLPHLHMCVECDTASGCVVPGNPRFYRFASYACPAGSYNELAVLLFNPQDEAIRALYTEPDGAFSPGALIVFATFYFVLANLTFGIAVPSGLFIPTMLFGAACGRLGGGFLATLGMRPAHASSGLYALLGAASFMGGTMRILVSLCVILLELTDSLSQVPLVMMAMMVAKSVGDRFNKSIYDEHVHLKHYPYLEPRPARSEQQGVSVGDLVVTGPSAAVTLKPRETASTVLQTLRTCTHNGFPVVDETGQLLGIVRRRRLAQLLYGDAERVSDVHDAPEAGGEGSGEGRFLRPRGILNPSPWSLGSKCAATWELPERSEQRILDVSSVMQAAPYVVSDQAPMHRAWRLFHDLALQHLVVVERSERVVGVLTRSSFMRWGPGSSRSCAASSALPESRQPLLDEPLEDVTTHV